MLEDPYVLLLEQTLPNCPPNFGYRFLPLTAMMLRFYCGPFFFSFFPVKAFRPKEHLLLRCKWLWRDDWFGVFKALKSSDVLLGVVWPDAGNTASMGFLGSQGGACRLSDSASARGGSGVTTEVITERLWGNLQVGRSWGSWKTGLGLEELRELTRLPSYGCGRGVWDYSHS